MSTQKNLNKFLEELIQEVEKELDEATATGNVAGYNTPAAFSDGGRKDKKRKKKIATSLGYSVVGNDVNNIDEVKYYITRNQGRGRGKSLVSGYDLKKDKKLPPKEFRTFKDAEKEIKRLKNTERGIPGGGSSYFVTDKKMNRLRESVNEAKVKRPVNRWLELKNDESMHPHKKMAMGLKELKYQLAETQKFFNWYNKIKTMNELDSDNYWKRTNKHIYKIKERLINIARTIQEIEK
jgi:hypothetical protein